MANTVGLVHVSLNMNPRETVTAEVTSSKSATVSIPSPLAPYKTEYWTSEAVTYQDTGTVKDGYLNGVPFYAQITNASTPVATITGTSYVEFLFLKNSGYLYDSSSALSATATTDHIMVRGGATDGFIVAVLGPQQAIALPVQSDSGWTTAADVVDSADYYFKSVYPNNLASGAGNIAMEFACLT